MTNLCDEPGSTPENPIEDPENTAYALLASLAETADATATAMKAQSYAALALLREVRTLRNELARRARGHH